MTSRRLAAVLLTALALAFSGLTVASAPATSAPPKTVLFNMYAHGTVAPKRIYLTADAGPWLKKLQWKNWGKARTSATGVYISNCASCAPPARRTATVWLSKPVVCTSGEGKGLRTYNKAVVILSAPDEGADNRVFEIPAGCP
ncbi:hypothetical protein GCM10009795_023800 [Nocardioides hankookensis]|uniref:Secreted protein n=1 Tax=Nocardioides hankookensis TaxID=443157 RepID=A0ABW1LHR8_9ACTN